jgi:hypothetical protein
MGMFDKIIFTCPNCQNPIEEQSKAGKCSLYEFSADAVPMAIAGDILHNAVRCDNCKEEYIIGAAESIDIPLVLIKNPYAEG